MYADYTFYAMQYREIQEQELAEREGESRRHTLTVSRGPSMRALTARRLFALAIAADRKETWNVVCKRLEAKGGL